MNKAHDQTIDHAFAETDRLVWRQLLLQGDIEQIQSIIKFGIPADLSLDADNPRAPLVHLAQHKPENENHARTLGEIARLLIHQGAPLTHRDYKRLLPLDYAIVGPNPHVAQEIFINTLRGYFHDQKYNAPSHPRLGIVFTTMADGQSRRLSCGRMQVNLTAMRKRLDQAINENDPHIMGLPPEELAFWRNLKTPGLENLPPSPQSLKTQFALIADLVEQHDQLHGMPQEQGHIAQSLQEAREEYSTLEWSIAKDMKP